MLVRLDPIEDLTEACLAISHGNRDLHDVRRLMLFLLFLSNVSYADGPRLKIRSQEDPVMKYVYDLWLEEIAEGEARGEARGVAQGRLDQIRQMVSQGMITITAARDAIADLLARQLVTPQQAQDALSQLG